VGEVLKLLDEDLHRYAGRGGLVAFLKHFIFTPGFKYTVWMRWTGYLKRRTLTRLTLYPVFKLFLHGCRYKFGITIPENAVVGGGLFINRFGGIYVHHDVVIGRNVNITHGVVLGQVNRGSKAGSPIIGDRVFFGSGAKVVGRVRVGDDAAIGVNALVVDDVPASAVMVAPAATLSSMRGSDGYINRQA
jgi:serine O-acetyltransferase